MGELIPRLIDAFRSAQFLSDETSVVMPVP
jgi:hypothetical protein